MDHTLSAEDFTAVGRDVECGSWRARVRLAPLRATALLNGRKDRQVSPPSCAPCRASSFSPARARANARLTIEQQFHEACSSADIEALMAVWSDDDEIVCVHPVGRA